MQPPAASEDPLSEVAIYDPSPAYPFGRRHPDAPPQLAQFEFMLGEFDCVDEIKGGNGKWRRTDAIWNAHYFLNGHGIQDVYWNETFATSNIRIFDPTRGKWSVNFFRSPTNRVGAGVWVGTQEGPKDQRRMVMWSGSPDRKNGSRLTFYDISVDGFEWVAESLRNGRATPSWKSSCRRRKPGRAPKPPAFRGWDANPAYPFGRRSQSAPRQLDRLRFQVGRFVEWCDGHALGVQNGRWFLNGWGVQTSSYRKAQSVAQIQVFDRTTKRFRVTRYRMPGYEWSVWDGPAGPGPITLRESLRNGAPPAAPRELVLTPPPANKRAFSVEIHAGDAKKTTERVECRPPARSPTP